MDYDLKILRNDPARVVPGWHFEPATPRQIKVLRLCGALPKGVVGKGVASGLIGRVFTDPANKQLWRAYVHVTGDNDNNCSGLLPYDLEELKKVVVPEEWRPDHWQPKREDTELAHETRDVLEEMALEVLKEGSPFDDPLPLFKPRDQTFCFTGKFQFGTRKQCQSHVVESGADFTDRVCGKTSVLVVGSDANPQWSHGTYGDKIVASMISRLRWQRPMIIPELYWLELMPQNPT